ncbi:hypothetical protein MGAST_11415 [Mycobacterium gastri 'Wayne']|uniref:Uncharacterized protein n=1 Tax=Mycobacterium gastri TaxID=1777 RepID=A0A1X1VTY8_MYCGS|nr:hypothetical protein MGAST_11415 [Mycobacterium gastri 'Wayne']ORV72542.1 hypothetical protein AWC07_00155 [Mycobacterium gastri]
MEPHPLQVLLAAPGSAIGCLDIAQNAERIVNRFEVRSKVVVCAVESAIQKLANELSAGHTLLTGQPVEAGCLCLI